MLITVPPPSYEPAMLYPRIPPPAILPKPGKDNLRLQRLLKKVAKKAPLTSQQAKSFQSSLSPVSEASPDLERSEQSPPLKTPETLTHVTIHLPPRFSIKPATHHHITSPFPKAKPFTLKVTEQKRISEYLKLTVSPAASQESPWQPQRTTKPDTVTQLPSPQPQSVFVFPDPPATEAPVEVTHVQVHARVHSVQAPRAKTPLSDQPSAALRSEDRQPLAAHTGKSHTEPPSGQVLVTLNADEAGAAAPKPTASMIPTLRAGPLNKITRPVSPKEPDGGSQVTKRHTMDTGGCAPRAKTPVSGQAPTVLSEEGRMSSDTLLEISHLEEPLGQTPLTHTTDQTTAAAAKSKAPMLPTVTAQPPHQPLKSSGPTEPTGTAFPGPWTPEPQSSSPEATGSDTARYRTAWAPELPEPHSKSQRPLAPHAAEKQEATVPADNTRAFLPEAMEESVIPLQPTATIPSTSSFPKAGPPPPPLEEKVRPLKSKLSGWSRLKKRLLVEPEGAQFPETEPAKPDHEEAGKKAEGSPGKASQDNRLIKSRATKMWDAILYQMTTLKRGKQQEEEKRIRKVEGFSLWRCLPLLHRPRFDARKLKELASKPMMKITTILESSLLHSKTTEEPKNFNRTASGWQLK
ncbi:proline-rich protein 33 [Carettochelys insculpta]|uniref:proline-rich protein 33 n=1 Tax=Carettochelys insculpta TaxID=44489 RepID=UPI003EBA7C48